MRQGEYEMICFRTAFCFVNILPPKIAQKNFLFKICIQISVFRRKKAFENPIHGCREICKINTNIFSKHPVAIHQLLIKFQFQFELSLAQLSPSLFFFEPKFFGPRILETQKGLSYFVTLVYSVGKNQGMQLMQAKIKRYTLELLFSLSLS